ncbi:MAG: hypothetical protein Homavirus35_4 [Homavirus sp.]|uniref:Uncharacterized protein n=1 Tax=Homavirus sp. TaxID=2487769 RepID=A0A3G5A952_9VIRU|nr:MAG: hypothetical protein Homavirus35_4 [Homavirus sp.]
MDISTVFNILLILLSVNGDSLTNYLDTSSQRDFNMSMSVVGVDGNITTRTYMNMTDNFNNHINMNNVIDTNHHLFSHINRLHTKLTFHYSAKTNNITMMNISSNVTESDNFTWSINIHYGDEIYISINSNNDTKMIEHIRTKLSNMYPTHIDKKLVINLWNYNDTTKISQYRIIKHPSLISTNNNDNDNEYNLSPTCGQTIVKRSVGGGVLIESLDFMPFYEIPLGYVDNSYIDYLDGNKMDMYAEYLNKLISYTCVVV